MSIVLSYNPMSNQINVKEGIHQIKAAKITKSGARVVFSDSEFYPKWERDTDRCTEEDYKNTFKATSVFETWTYNEDWLRHGSSYILSNTTHYNIQGPTFLAHFTVWWANSPGRGEVKFSTLLNHINAWLEDGAPMKDGIPVYSFSSSSSTSTKEKTSVSSKSELWSVVDTVLRHSRRVLLRGRPGTGKTYAAMTLGKTSDETPIYTITMTEETPAAEIRGHFVPKDKEMIWMDGPAIRAWREGARLVINEIDRAGGDCHSLMYALLDDPEFAALTLPTGETVRPAEGFQVIATMNGEPDDLPVALQDRFPVTIEITEVNPEALKSLPGHLASAAKASSLAPDPERNISIRLWSEFAHLQRRLMEVDGLTEKQAEKIAARAIFDKRANDALKVLAQHKIGD